MGVTAHLKPYQWRAGQSGNPRGKPKGGASMVEWRNTMATWSRDRLLKVVDPKSKAPPPKQAAAAEWLTAMEHGRLDAHGRLDPEPGKARQRIEERDMGKPMQQMDILTQQLQAPRPPGEVLPQLVPMLVRALTDPMVQRALAAAGLVVQRVLPPVDGVATVLPPAGEIHAGGPAPPQAAVAGAGGSALTSGLACEGPVENRDGAL
jgi:hypothetical protein